ncbi:Cytochrome b2, mitochondrial [Lecanosticta acicola]|uniref:Cytochrome b2, mitochondrial n=1 Tax=Lecanosticta acicola TaxID=111012 RepID=A0AAI8W268_9PEZI|nr:Cytochrome b2, mitochondrial [Lecanosticta acicola]
MAPNDGKVTVAEITKHSSAQDCWVVVNGKVYDLTKFAPNHPGGAYMIHKWAGKDGSETYNQFHSSTLIEDELSPEEKLGDLDESTVTDTWIEAQKRETTQKEADPNEKPPLSTLINLDDFERAFEKSGSEKAWVYIWAGSNDLLSLSANKQAWHRLWFRPRIMRNVSAVDTKTKMMGADVSMPVYICPMGIAKTAGPQGEAALGSGAAGSGIVHCMSTTASMSVEEILASVPPTYPYFFQLYVDRNRAKTEATLAKIEGYSNIKAIFVTVDLAVVSKREADERLIVQETVSVYSGEQKSNVDKKGGGLARTTGSFIDWALSWEDIPWLRKHTSKPIVIKGIQSAADAKIAMEMGCEGIVISNHGGRALDNSPATLLILLELRRDCPKVFSRMEVYIDGGVRRGSDVLKAVLLGARGVGVGRPFQCAVLYDKEGVEHAASILQDELETAMRLSGITSLDAVRGKFDEHLNTVELEASLPSVPKWRWASWLNLFGSRQSKL